MFAFASIFVLGKETNRTPILNINYKCQKNFENLLKNVFPNLAKQLYYFVIFFINNFNKI